MGEAGGCILSCLFKSSRFRVFLFPVVDVVAASCATGRLELGLRLIASSRPLTRSLIEMFFPLRARKPWFASEFSSGHGLRPRGCARQQCSPPSTTPLLRGPGMQDSRSPGAGARHSCPTGQPEAVDAAATSQLATAAKASATRAVNCIVGVQILTTFYYR